MNGQTWCLKVKNAIYFGTEGVSNYTIDVCILQNLLKLKNYSPMLMHLVSPM